MTFLINKKIKPIKIKFHMHSNDLNLEGKCIYLNKTPFSLFIYFLFILENNFFIIKSLISHIKAYYGL